MSQSQFASNAKWHQVITICISHVKELDRARKLFRIFDAVDSLQLKIITVHFFLSSLDFVYKMYTIIIGNAMP